MYIISNYKELYNPTNTRGGDLKNAVYVKMPVKPRGKGVRALLKKPKGLEIFGIWALLLEAATESTTPGMRGKLLNHKDEAASVDEIAGLISLDGQISEVKHALEVLSEDMGWIENVPCTERVRSASVLDTDKRQHKESDKQQHKISKDKISKDKLREDNETETEAKLREEKLRDSIISLKKVSDSDSRQPHTIMTGQVFLLKLSEIFSWNGSDHTTFRNLAKHLIANDVDLDIVLQQAEDCRGPTVKKPKAKFIALCKKLYNFEKTVELIR